MTTELTLQLLVGGYCTHPGFVVNPRRASWAPQQFPAMFALLRHPIQGLILYDTGYAPRFFAETARFPASLYRRATPVVCTSEQTAVAQLARQGIRPDDIGLIILSHFHADHVAGLLDFPRARLLYLRAALDPKLRHRSVWANVRRGLLPGLLPTDLTARSTFADDLPRVPLPDLAPFKTGYDLLGDGSLLGIEVSGHAPGQLGLFFTAQPGRPVFLVADASWTRHAFVNLELPWPPVRLIIHDMAQYRGQIHRLHELANARPDILLVPSHCQESIDLAVSALQEET
ncbi:MBL fold metallo-hydrolase [Hymenobacter negativus]|uniref:MBL fold metallo-hydrolase n=1 Tax=Hymenobacter negativus TaxID=2795026 RepID=A0ABS3QLN6_9BACT|nr:MBL fold metallo-hydrolase [Hymenobacter negativus]MBO2012185.1 MBL fold metallo-hydrolase [Hymenobacter negativus]